MLGHADREMTMHYTHVEGERVRAGLERVADRLLKKREAGGGQGEEGMSGKGEKMQYCLNYFFDRLKILQQRCSGRNVLGHT